jgi:hypothetical protein
VTWADRGSLPYIEATLLEIQRLANIGEYPSEVDFHKVQKKMIKCSTGEDNCFLTKGKLD